MKTVVFCLPAYNEEKIMTECTLRLLQYLKSQNYPWQWRINILVNGSNDMSATIAQDLSNQHEKISACIYSEPGRGQALHRYWTTCEDDILAYMDIDLAVALNNISDLINPIYKNEANLTVGSRLISGSSTNRSILRHIVSHSYSVIAQLILWQKLPDLQCGFKAIDNTTFKEISSYATKKHWFFDTELIVFTKIFNYKVKSVPVDWMEGRFEKRKTKVKLVHDSIKFIKDLIDLKLKLKAFKNKKGYGL
jgi:dolichyl-phosphate beta-glucosyltransferase